MLKRVLQPGEKRLGTNGSGKGGKGDAGVKLLGSRVSLSLNVDNKECN